MAPRAHRAGQRQGRRAMLMEVLFERPVTDYLRDAAIGTDPCVFVHIPKTAGTSLRTELAALLEPSASIAVDAADGRPDFRARMDDAVEQFLKDGGPAGIRFVSGHLLARHAARLRSHYTDARFVTLLRNPVDRVVSDYRHQRSPRNPLQADFTARFPTLKDYVDFAPEQNRMARHLVPDPLLASGRAAACIAYIMRAYAFVGIQEMYEVSFLTVTALSGRPRLPSLRINVNEDDEDERRVTTAMAQYIGQANRLDVAIYDHFHARLAGAAPALSAVLAAA
ncbi:sulfotransferase family 2 domain-containing protein [Falsiroseomonas ponticola]|uniref:sulfotransferase family 2 domain-containing protein n=1 Tax=Falsiroseomonas ponticola TaxID=2786951 RepID=UPI001933C304|nr:sulfotransferase family 2 domain-containing protein [Roseomonas ponticola]